MAKLCPLFSGSKGNCIYLGASGNAILIDAGRSAKQIENAIVANSLDISIIKAIFVTHEHIDHIRGIKTLASKYNMKVYSSKGTMDILNQKGILNGKFEYGVIEKDGVEESGMYIKSFKTSHDCKESVGYIIKTPDNKKVVIATDLGYISDEVREAICGSDAVVIESNHDIGMLENGYYPYALKRRILSNQGHLSNIACAKELPYFLKHGTRRFILAHLSKENNMPELAYQTSVCHLEERGMKNGIDFLLDVAPEVNNGNHKMIF